MKTFKFLPFFLILCLSLSVFCVPFAQATLAEPAVDSPTILLMDRQSGEVLFSRAENQRVYPASTTKVMTVLLAVEAIERGSISLSDQVTATESAMQGMIPEGSSAGIVPGEIMTLENLLYCAMVASANEACNVIAEYVAESVPDFVKQMNDRAVALGCTATHFANTHGLPDDNHYTTLSDYSRIAAEAMRHHIFTKICGTDQITIPATNVSGERELHNSNALVSARSVYGSSYVYEGAYGIKTGHTNAAGYCLASAASKNGLDLLALVFGASDSDTCFRDSVTLYDWAFENFSYQDILKSTVNIASVDVALGSDSDYVNLHPSTSITALLPNDTDLAEFENDIRVYSLENGESVTAPVSAGQVLGEVTVTRGNRNYGTVKLVASSTVELSRMQYIKSQLRETTQKKSFRLTVIILALLFLLYIVWVVWYRVKRLQHKKALKDAEKARLSAAPTTVRSNPTIDYFRPAEGPELPEEEVTQEGREAAPTITQIPRSAADADDLLRDAVCVATLPGASKAAHSNKETPAEKAERDYFEEFFRK